MPTILITGCSSGFGLETARYFLERNWRVVATMRTPREGLLPPSALLQIIELDVTSAASIAHAVRVASPIDVLVNNAGVGLLGALEGLPMETVREIFEINTLGTIAMTQAVLPQFRERRSGVIVNVSSSVTLGPRQLFSVYTASKAAINSFSESLALELEPFNIRVRLVIPGRAPDTRFGENARSRMADAFPDPYRKMAEQVFAGWQESAQVTHAVDVATAVWRAVSDPSCPMRLAAGADTIAQATSC